MIQRSWKRSRALHGAGLGFAAVLCFAAPARAQPAPPVGAPALTPAWQKARYSLPWGLRPGIAPNLVRLDTVYALTSSGNSWASLLTAGYRPISSLQTLGFYVRWGVVGNYPGNAGTGTADNLTVASNPLLMALYTPEVAPHFRLAPFFALALPFGGGGGDPADASAAARAAIGAGINLRSAMDNALFAANYFTVIGGLGATWVDHGLTVQGEVTVLQLLRVRGENWEKDGARTNFTTGLHVGYQLFRPLTVSAELRYQHWLSDATRPNGTALPRAQLTAGIGVRANIPLSRTALLRPGFSFSLPLDGQMGDAQYRLFQFDVALPF